MDVDYVYADSVDISCVRVDSVGIGCVLTVWMLTVYVSTSWVLTIYKLTLWVLTVHIIESVCRICGFGQGFLLPYKVTFLQTICMLTVWILL